jgi:hypothetical protein
MNVCKENKKSQILVLMINNYVSSITERIKNIEEIYKFYCRMCGNSQFTKIYIISVMPKIHVFEMISENFFSALFQQKYFYDIDNAEFMFETVMNKIIDILAKIKANEQLSDINFYILNKWCKISDTDIEKLKLHSVICEIIIDYCYPNVQEIKFSMTDDNLIFQNLTNKIEGTIDGKILILCKSNGVYENATSFNDITKLLQYVYEMYIVYNDCFNDFTFSFFDKYISIINDKISIIDQQFYTIINIIKKWLYFNRSISIKIDCILNNFNKNMEIGHICHKKYLKMITNLKKNSEIECFNEKLEKTFNKVIKTIQNIDNNETEKSTLFYNSQYSLSDWRDEIEEKGCLGVLLNIFVPNFSRNGKSLNMIEIKNITLCLISVSDFINIICSESNTSYTYDINISSILNDNILGSGNIVLPLYINKYHWEICKEYIPIILSLLVTNNVSLYCSNMYNIYYSVLFEYTKNIFSNKNVNWSHNWIMMWIGIFRTCFQISSEKRYHKGFTTYINNLDISKLNGKYGILLGQMLSIGYIDIDFINNIFNNHVLNLITSYINENAEYKKIFIEMLKDDDKQIQKELILIYNYLKINEIIDNYISIIFGIKLIIFIRNLDRGLLNFIKAIDKHYGVVSDEYVEKIFDFCGELRNEIHNKKLYTDNIIPFNISKIGTHLKDHKNDLFYEYKS